MTDSAHESGPAAAGAETRKDRQQRPRMLMSISVWVGIFFGVAAFFLDGTIQTAVAAVSIACLAAAAYCVPAMWLGTSNDLLDEPPSEPPVLQSHVTLVYDPGAPRDNGLKNVTYKATHTETR